MTDQLPVVRSDGKAGERSLDLLRWGLVPYWAKDLNVGFANINAKPNGSRRSLPSVDVAVVGLGAMGSAALYAAARRGLRVIGFDRLEPGHNRSSSFGESRVIRLAYFEHPSTSRFFAAPIGLGAILRSPPARES